MHSHGQSGMSKEKEKVEFKYIKKLLAYAKAYMPAIIVAIIFALISATTSIIGPNKISDLMLELEKGLKSVTGVDIDAFKKICIILIALYLGGSMVHYAQQFIMAEVTQRISKKLRKDIDKKINKLPLKYFDTTTRGDILSRVTNDVDTISQTLGTTIANLVNAVTLFFGVVFMMFKVNWILALVTIGASLFGFILMFAIISNSQKYFNRRQVHLGVMNGHIEEVYTYHNIVKSYNGEEKARKKFKKTNDELYSDNWKSQFLSGLMMPIMSFSGNLSYAAIFIVGVALILKGNSNISFGTIIEFTIYARLFTQPLSTLAQSMTSIQQASASSKRVFELLEEKELEDESNKTNELTNVEGNIQFENVKFGYTEDKEIIHGFNVNIKKGQKVAIVGPTGAGKTTIVNLLMRFYEVNSGQIKIDGIPSTDITRENVHDLFDMILQDTWLFNGTIRENIVYNKKNVSDDELDKICKAVGLRHFIKSLPKGYDTLLDDSLSLSEGQKQQLTIARAMIKDAPLLILDEATSSVDTRTELAIQEAMDNLMKGRTSFVIAHRLSTIRNADIILVMKDGDIIEQGKHQELLEKDSFYAELYKSQFEIVS